MEKLFKCEVCGLVLQESMLKDKCPKCMAPIEKFKEVAPEVAEKIYRSDKTNDLLAKIIDCSMKLDRIATQGIEDNLDPGCVHTFKVAKESAWTIKQIAKAEIAIHLGKEKW